MDISFSAVQLVSPAHEIMSVCVCATKIYGSV